MTDLERNNDALLSVLNCALSVNESEHICENPVVLSCGHYICKNCIRPKIKYDTIKCKICNTVNTRDLQEVKEPIDFNVLLMKHLHFLHKIIFDKYTNKFKLLKEMSQNVDETVENHVEFIKEEINIRIESIKLELDVLHESLNDELNDIKNKWKEESKNVKIDGYDEQLFENELKKLEDNIRIQEGLTEESLYYYQNKIMEVENVLHEYRNKTPELRFTVNDKIVEKDLICQLELTKRMDKDFEKKIINKIENNECQKFVMGLKIYDICVLPNDNLLFTTYNTGRLLLYDGEFKLIKCIDKINDKIYNTVCMTSDETNNIFLTDYMNGLIIKTDFELNQVALFGNGVGSGLNQLKGPYGICYYNQHIYVSDMKNNRIQKFDTNFTYKLTLMLVYSPAYIKNIKNVAVVRPSIYGATSSTYFYDLDNFNLLKKYDGHNGILGIGGSRFYEFYAPNKMLYCYDKNGELLHNIPTDGLDWPLFNNNCGFIFIHKSKIYFNLFDSSFITVEF